jgi:hypothetical protein
MQRNIHFHGLPCETCTTTVDLRIDDSMTTWDTTESGGAARKNSTEMKPEPLQFDPLITKNQMDVLWLWSFLVCSQASLILISLSIYCLYWFIWCPSFHFTTFKNVLCQFSAFAREFIFSSHPKSLCYENIRGSKAFECCFVICVQPGKYL